MSSKKERSLGIKNFRSHNKSYYGNGSGDSTQKIVLYGGGGSSTKNEQQDQWIIPSLISTDGTNIWKTVWKFWEEYALNIRFTVGNGRRISFWCEIWLRHGPPKDIFPDLFCLTTSSESVIEGMRSS